MGIDEIGCPFKLIAVNQPFNHSVVQPFGRAKSKWSCANRFIRVRKVKDLGIAIGYDTVGEFTRENYPSLKLSFIKDYQIKYLKH